MKRSFLATLLLSHGTPMLLAGDEIGNSQEGNNNVYCQDTALSWIDWGAAGQPGRELSETVKALIALREAHPIFRRASFRDGCVIRWLGPEGNDLAPGDWDDPAAAPCGLLMRNEAIWEGAQEALVLFNPLDEPQVLVLPDAPHWVVLADTASASIGDPRRAEGDYALAAKALVVLAPANPDWIGDPPTG